MRFNFLRVNKKMIRIAGLKSGLAGIGIPVFNISVAYFSMEYFTHS